MKRLDFLTGQIKILNMVLPSTFFQLGGHRINGRQDPFIENCQVNVQSQDNLVRH